MQIPLFKPQTEWLPPENFPDLSKYNEIAIDLETKDPELMKMGSGSVVGQGDVVGVAVAVAGWSGYYPIAHEGGGNMSRAKVLKWFQGVLNTSADKIFHNAMYDVCWIRALSLNINGRIIDTMIASALVDENQMRYDLNSCAKRYTGKGKNETDLYQAAKDWGVDAKAEMYKLPAIYVGAYAEKDAEITLELWQELKKEILHQDIESIFDMETELFPCLVEMKFLGVKVDVQRAHTMKQELSQQEAKLIQKVKKETGVDTQIWAARSIAQVFDKLKLDYDRTEKTSAPSFTKNFLQNHPHPTVKLIAQAREINKAHTTFIDTILKHSHKGRIHADINQLRSDNGGTVTGRFYAALQNLYGVDDVLDAYREGDADFHTIVADMAEIPRSQAKTINLGLFYGMGKNKLQAELGVSKDVSDSLFRQYHNRVPFVKQLMDNVMSRAQDSGKIRTLLGRLCRFHLWEPNQFGIHKALPHDAALMEHGPGIKRAYTYKALNKLIQGSAADMTKKAMIELHKEGIIPHIQVHDELDISIEDPAHAEKIKQIMESAVELEVPNKVDYESGPNWGQIK
jgi:DNA polymerase-1